MTTLLVVDDDEDIREMLAKLLHQHGYAVITASDGLEAVHAAANSHPALILMDLNMPELDGFEATMEIRQTLNEVRIPIIALTGHGLAGDEARAMVVGCDAFHAKPMDFEKLLKQIEVLIETTSPATHDHDLPQAERPR